MDKLFLNLKEIAQEKDLISKVYETDKWREIQYKTKLGEGIMLVGAEDANPQSITFNIDLKGWHRVFVGMLNLRTENYTYLKLSRDLCYSGIRHARQGSPASWGSEEYAEEVFFGSFDLTNQKLIMAKPDSMFTNTAGLLWIRCEEMTDDEVKAHLNLENNKNKCIQMHIDADLHAEDKTECEDDYLIRLYKMKNTNTDFCSLEYAFDHGGYEYKDELTLHHFDKRWTDGDYKFMSVKDSVYKKYVSFAHEIGIELFASERMGVASFSTPYTRLSWKDKFCEDNKQFYCKNRDGSTVSVCSYAYTPVQDYVLKNMKEVVSYGFDGVTMIFHRGMHLGFEQPFIDKFKAIYPDINPCELPISDERLHGVWCDVMTDFMRRARKELGENIKINVITDYGLETAKNLGLDIELWAKEGLVDIVTQADMETYEDLTDCMSDENPKLIDLEKYKNRILDYPPIRRKFGTNSAKITEHINEFISLEENYGVKVYHVLPWIGALSIDEYNSYVTKLQSMGAKRFLSWNAYGAEWNIPEWYYITHIGNESNDEIVKHRFVRMLQLDNRDISHFNNNWRG